MTTRVRSAVRTGTCRMCGHVGLGVKIPGVTGAVGSFPTTPAGVPTRIAQSRTSGATSTECFGAPWAGIRQRSQVRAQLSSLLAAVPNVPRRSLGLNGAEILPSEAAEVVADPARQIGAHLEPEAGRSLL